MLAGDEVKRDQFKFIYNTMKVIYDSALKDYFLSDDPKVHDTVVPQLVAYHSLLLIKNIQETKDLEKKKELEKLEREGKKVTFAEGEHQEEEKKLTFEE